jgi:hypothetical protein
VERAVGIKILPAAQQRVSLSHLRIRNFVLGARDLCRTATAIEMS